MSMKKMGLVTLVALLSTQASSLRIEGHKDFKYCPEGLGYDSASDSCYECKGDEPVLRGGLCFPCSPFTPKFNEQTGECEACDPENPYLNKETGECFNCNN